MKLFLAVISVLIFSFASVFADVGDTIIVQTIDYETPVLPGWNSPRSGTYLFPHDSVSFSKILMSYKLKCDPSQSPACGEWDYTTHTRIMEHTGIYDSTLYYHPNYIVNNQSPDSFMMMLTPSYFYTPILEYFNQTSPTNTAEPGNGNQEFTIPFNDNSIDGRSQIIYSQTELINAGLTSGEITGIQLYVLSGSIDLKHFTIKIGHIDIDILPTNSFVEDGFTDVYSRNRVLEPGNSYINFSFPFIWDGTQNIIIDISYADYTGSVILQADLSATNQTIISGDNDYFLDFEGWDYIDVPKDAFNTIDSAITISFWQYGNPDIQPINSSIFEGVDSLGRRVLNAHLPWSNGKVY